MSHKWTQNDIPDLTGKVVVITGANSGLGLESTKAIAAKGATVVMACRNLSKADKAKTEVLALHPGAKLDVMQLDNASLDSVRAFAAAFRAKYDRLDILLNNAGVMAIPRQETADGFEMQLGVNHLAHFALTGLLLDLLTSTPGARVHNVSSSANYNGSINFDDLMGAGEYGRWSAYGQSKLANVFFTYELNKRLAAAGHDTISNTSHPGLVMGNLQSNSLEQSGSSLMERILYGIACTADRPGHQHGRAAAAVRQHGGSRPKGASSTGRKRSTCAATRRKKRPTRRPTTAAALRRFWEMSEELTGVKYPL
jgi:protochlorophyllide reductase